MPGTIYKHYVPKHASLTSQWILTAVIVIEVITATALFLKWQSLPTETLDVWFLDVGQGDATLIRGPYGSMVLVDGGPDSKILIELGAVLPYFERTIDVLIITHPDLDHIGGLMDVFSAYHIRTVVMTERAHTSDAYKTLVTAIQEEGADIVLARADADFLIDHAVRADILFPTQTADVMNADPINNSSVTLRMSYGATSFLLTGDIEKETESLLVQRESTLHVDILKTPHHGSKTSSTELFLDTVRPAVAIISVGKENRYRHPHPDVIARYEARGIEVLRTDERGTIHVSCSLATYSKRFL